MTLKFAKYEGLGNDFIVVDARTESDVDAREARKLCDRHFGVGGDGVLLVLPPSRGGRARMVIWNADGSRPEMCGNGIRCVALHLARRDGLHEERFAIETDAGVLACDLKRMGASAEVAVAMGRAQALGEHRASDGGQSLTFARISMGNPHAVVFDSGYDEARIDRFAPSVSGAFAEGCNIEFASTRGPREFDLVVWERGVGRTLACGTGACATVAAAALAGRAPFGEPVRVHLPGGPLLVTVAPDTLEVLMRGPARWVFSGEV